MSPTRGCFCTRKHPSRWQGRTGTQSTSMPPMLWMRWQLQCPRSLLPRSRTHPRSGSSQSILRVQISHTRSQPLTPSTRSRTCSHRPPRPAAGPHSLVPRR
ncbi:hypothetical protein T492DRAFT_517015 [Pavlovales sp. CCMP2436]|nr:hypothetical protein T492DRAFT_517015 [Pavlovales sp. CCMP2436]